MNISRLVRNIAIGLCLFILSTTLAAIGGYFTPTICAALGACLIGALGFDFWKQRTHPNPSDARDKLALALVIGLGIFHALFAHDVQLGRDDSVYLASAVKISETHSLAFTDPLVIPFHGFRAINAANPARVTSQFLPAYSVYLAMWNSVAGINGIFAANSLLVALGFFAFYKSVALVKNSTAGLVAVVLFAGSYTALWFPRRTVSENLMLLLVWLGAWIFLEAVQTKKIALLATGFLPISLLLLLRGEAIAFVVVYLVACAIALRDFKQFHREWPKTLAALIPSAAAAGGLLLYTRIYGSAYLASGFKEAGTASAHPALIAAGVVGLIAIGALLTRPRAQQEKILRLTAALGIAAAVVGEIIFRAYLAHHDLVRWQVIEQQFVLDRFWDYLLVPFIAIAAIGFFLRAYRAHTAYILLLCAPAAVFLLHPSIAIDQPWFMRRFFPVIIPIIYALAAITLVHVFQKQKLIIALLAISAIQLSLAYPLINFKENQGIRAAFTTFSAQFTHDDLVIMEPGWTWQQWAYGLHFINHVDILPSFEHMTPDTLAQLVGAHRRVFLLTSQGSKYAPGWTSYDNLERLPKSDLALPNLPSLDRIRWIATEVDNHVESGEPLSLTRLQTGLYDIPPRTVRLVNERYDLYQIKNPALIKFTPDNIIF